jgi:hypothetical protein
MADGAGDDGAIKNAFRKRTRRSARYNHDVRLTLDTRTRAGSRLAHVPNTREKKTTASLVTRLSPP